MNDDSFAQVQVRQISAWQTHALRLEVLRPGKSPESAVFSGDEDDATIHWGLFTEAGGKTTNTASNEAPLAIATLMRSSLPSTGQLAWQVRGMASSPQVRGRGYGTAVLKAIIRFVNQMDPCAVIWCNARTSALEFYRSHGFETLGDEFEIAGVGPHYLMVLQR